MDQMWANRRAEKRAALLAMTMDKLDFLMARSRASRMVVVRVAAKADARVALRVV